MPKPAGLPSLNLTAAPRDDGRLGPLSPRSLASPMSPRSIPTSPILSSPGPHTTMHPLQANEMVDRGVNGNGPASPHMTAIPDIPSSPDRELTKHGRDTSKSFFSNLLASKSSHRLQTSDMSLPEHEKAHDRSRGNSRERLNYELRTKSSKAELPQTLVNGGKPLDEPREDGNNLALPLAPSDSNSINQKKSRNKLGVILNRSKGSKPEDEYKKKAAPPLSTSSENGVSQNGRNEPNSASLKTAPLKSDYRERALGERNGSIARTRSADRSDTTAPRKPGTSSSMAPSTLKDTSVLAGIHSTGRGVSDRWGKAGKGFLSKITRSGSSTEREIPSEENYVCTTINLPLVEQTRKTRIAKRLELSRDKTEFWMPALPWRCIDYLNMNGCEEEGLYRIPGSGREVKVWQKRFDTEADINLFEEPDLYDINTIGSMFKSWLRELPDEILPKATQTKISRECAGSMSTPQLLKDELSRLPPFNYYLLFAITCHLSLLHSFADKNKMDYRNLCICFQPCLKIDAFCFQFLVINWKECWQGCWTEHQYLQEEYRWEKEGSIRKENTSTDDRTMNRGTASMDERITYKGNASMDNRAMSSNGSSQTAPLSLTEPRNADANLQRKNSAPSAYNKQKNTSVGVGPSHVNSPSLSAVPRVVTTPESRKVPEQELPELGNLSPIRM